MITREELDKKWATFAKELSEARNKTGFDKPIREFGLTMDDMMRGQLIALECLEADFQRYEANL